MGKDAENPNIIEIVKDGNFNAKILPPHVDINTSQSITPQHTLIVPLREPLIGIIIDDKEVINTHQQTFSILWDSV